MIDEPIRRNHLGIPSDAPEVLVVAESTHWDPDWLLTSTEYLRLMVAPTLDAALDALTAEPRRVYSVECAFFPELYLRARPERRDVFIALANEGRLRFTGSGVSTPDTLLPEDEMLLRDLAEGTRWLRENGITAEPRSLYLPDSFGHSPGVPALLRAAGVDYAGICRIDGMRFPGAELEAANHFPWPGTTAARLYEEASADFVWRSPDGSEVLTHWHGFGYGHGDMVAHSGFTRVMGLPFAWASRAPEAVAARIEEYLAELRPLARTPYRLLSIGFDFSRPIPGLIELIDTWNTRDYERTGVWLVNAALEDYLDLVSAHRDELPTIEADPNPYWTGFYATRPALKRACRDLGRELVTLDASRVRRNLEKSDKTAGGDTDDERCSEARWVAATTNHHDLVTGTSPDRTARREQWPWVDAARSQVAAAITRLAASASAQTGPSPSAQGSETADGSVKGTRATTRRDGDLITVSTRHFRAVFDEAHGGTLVRLAGADGGELVHRGTLACVAIGERGGLWRMGYEFPGGRWQAADSTADHPARVTVRVGRQATTAVIHAALEGRPVRLEVTFPDAEPVIGVSTSLQPRLRRSIVLQWRGRAPIGSLEMHQPGAVVDRPLQRRFNPTFWPLHSWAATRTAAGGHRLAVATATPTALHALDGGTTEIVVARTALRELAWGIVPLLGPATGFERGAQGAHLAFAWPDRDEPARRKGRAAQRYADRLAGRRILDWPIRVDDPDAEIIAVKPADRGDGIIVRLRNWDVVQGERTARVTVAADNLPDNLPDDNLPGDPYRRITAASCCDANERDRRALTVTDGNVHVPLDAHLVSVRLHIRTVR